MRPGAKVRHHQFGPGEVIRVLGGQASVLFFGEELMVPATELCLEEAPEVGLGEPSDGGRVLFRRCQESLNLGVVPPEPDQLLALTIGGGALQKQTREWLTEAHDQGLCKVVFGDYGQGKSHLLKVIRAAAIREGWVVSFVEFDPKQADPAKPHLVYRAITGGLCFPTREDGSRSRDFFDLVGEARKGWDTVSMGPQFRMSPWFGPTLRALRFHSHSREDPDYVQAVEWLAGQPVGFAVVRGLCRAAGRSVQPPPLMPKTLETADIYVSHLVTIHEMCRALGYKGLLVILDEAEHIRGFNVNRRERANNLFDILARCAHLPRRTATGPFGNSHGVDVGRAWAQGPHFGLVVALTPGDMHVDDIDELKRSCVFVHDDRDVVRLRPPSVRDYMAWCQNYLSEYVTHYPGSRVVAGSPDVPRVLAGVLAEEYARQAEPERNIRLWGKMAAFCCALDMNESVESLDQMTETLRRVARSAAGEIMPWEL